MGNDRSPDVRVFDSVAALHGAAAALVVAAATNALRRRGVFHLGLAGGKTPRGLYELLATEPWRERIDWTRTHAWFGDERCVPFDHPDSNFGMASAALLSHVSIPPSQVHRMRGEIEPDSAARAYEAELHAAGGPLDLLLLGMGADGHTASLFPGAAELEERRRWVIPAVAPVEPRRRLTLTLPAIRQARSVTVLVAGIDKAPTLNAVLSAPEHRQPGLSNRADRAVPLPAARLRAASGAVRWLVDRDGASRMPVANLRA